MFWLWCSNNIMFGVGVIMFWLWCSNNIMFVVGVIMFLLPIPFSFSDWHQKYGNNMENFHSIWVFILVYLINILSLSQKRKRTCSQHYQNMQTLPEPQHPWNLPPTPPEPAANTTRTCSQHHQNLQLTPPEPAANTTKTCSQHHLNLQPTPLEPAANTVRI